MGKHSADTPLSSRLPTVGELLELLPAGWQVVPGLHALVPELAEADEVVVGPGGVFVVVAPEWAGPFAVEGDVVSANGVTRERETEACLDTAVAVATLAGTYAEWIVPVLCVTSEDVLLDWAMEARVCSLASLLDALTGAPVVLPPSHVNHAAHVLRTAGTPQPEPEPVVALPPRHEPTVAPEPPPAPAPEAASEIEAPAVPVGQPDGQPDGQPAGKSSARSRRVAAALAAAEATAAQVAADAAARGETPRKEKKKKSEQGPSRVRSLVALLVAAAVVGVLALNGPRLVPALRGVYDQVNGAPTCVPAAGPAQATTTRTKPLRVPRTDRHGRPPSKAARAKARKKAAARAKRLALRPVSAPALEAAAC